MYSPPTALTVSTFNFSLVESDIRAFLQEAPHFSISKHLRTTFFAIFALIILPITGFYALNYEAYQRLGSVSGASGLADAKILANTHVSLTVPATAQPLPASAFAPPTQPRNTLYYPDLSLSVPIIWGVPFDESTIQQNLENGIVQIAGTATPGQTGYGAFFGHSSNYPWVKGKYNSVLAVLQKAQVGQLLVVNYNDREYTYKVSKVYVVQPTDLSVLQDGGGSGIRLITCTPIGTSLRRLVVQAEQINPDPASNAPFTNSRFTGTVPSTR